MALATTKLFSAFETNFTFGSVDAIYMGSRVWHAFRLDPRLTRNFTSVLSGYQLGTYGSIPIFSDILILENQSFLEPEAITFVDGVVQGVENFKGLPDFIQALHDQGLSFQVEKIPDLKPDEEKISEWSRNLLTVLEYQGEVTIKHHTQGYKLTVDCYERDAPSLATLLADAFAEI